VHGDCGFPELDVRLLLRPIDGAAVKNRSSFKEFANVLDQVEVFQARIGGSHRYGIGFHSFSRV
jgi:hypothetical protein